MEELEENAEAEEEEEEDNGGGRDVVSYDDI